MSFTTAQIEQFKQYGYLAVPHFWDAAETKALQVEVDRLKREGALTNPTTILVRTGF